MSELFEKLKQITEGYINLITDNPKIKPIAEKRSAICASCPINVNNFCNTELGGCGCYLSAKVASPNSKCPKGKW